MQVANLKSSLAEAERRIAGLSAQLAAETAKTQVFHVAKTKKPISHILPPERRYLPCPYVQIPIHCQLAKQKLWRISRCFMFFFFFLLQHAV